MRKTAQDCQKLKARIEALEEALDEQATVGSLSSVQTGSERTSWSVASPNTTRRRLAELKREYENGHCAIVLGEAQPRKAVRRITPFVGPV